MKWSTQVLGMKLIIGTTRFALSCGWFLTWSRRDLPTPALLPQIHGDALE
jgi:hypothetical protein